MNESPDDLFAPRPKLSQGMRMIQVCALLMATGISVSCLWFNLLILANKANKIEASFTLLPNIGFQLLILLPCWRAWMLRRWACFQLIFIILVSAAGLLVNNTGSGLLVFLLAAIFLVTVVVEWPHLKSGF